LEKWNSTTGPNSNKRKRLWEERRLNTEGKELRGKEGGEERQQGIIEKRTKNLHQKLRSLQRKMLYKEGPHGKTDWTKGKEEPQD